jgi:hypothetical protein
MGYTNLTGPHRTPFALSVSTFGVYLFLVGTNGTDLML